MYRNVGEDCKTFAKALCWLGIIGSVLGGIGLMITGALSQAGQIVLLGIVFAVLGSLLSWGGGLILYAIGEMTVYSKISVTMTPEGRAAVRKYTRAIEEEEDEEEDENRKPVAHDPTIPLLLICLVGVGALIAGIVMSIPVPSVWTALPAIVGLLLVAFAAVKKIRFEKTVNEPTKRRHI